MHQAPGSFEKCLAAGRIALGALLVVALFPVSTVALSEFGSNRGHDSREQAVEESEDLAPGLPLPEPLINRSVPRNDGAQEVVTPEAGDPVAAEIILDPTLLPEPVRRMRELLVEATRGLASLDGIDWAAVDADVLARLQPLEDTPA